VDKWIEQKKATILAQPRVSTTSGTQAQVRAVREEMYPTEFGMPAPGPITTSIPSAYRTREVGALLTVTPVINPDQSSISVTMIPELVKLLGFLKYDGYFPQGKSSVDQPDISSVNAQTSISLPDGATVLLTIHEPQPKGKHDHVMLALFRAAIHPIHGRKQL
jgi:type II secretory pathway component GspD/PulD (secretin)